MISGSRCPGMPVVVMLVFAGFLATAGVPREVHAQTSTGVYLALAGTAALQPDDVIGAVGIGIQGGYRWPWGLMIQGDVIYTGKDYYYFDTDRRSWRQADTWGEVPSGDFSRGNWPFYRERFLLGIGAGLSGEMGPVGLFAAAGFMVSVLNIADIGDSYPEFADAAKVTQLGDVGTEVNTTVRMGIVWPTDRMVSGQLGYMILLRDDSDVAGERAWIQRNSLLSLGVTVHLGGGQ